MWLRLAFVEVISQGVERSFAPRALQMIQDTLPVGFAPLLAADAPERGVEPVEEDIPTIALDPPPDAWPDPAAFVESP